MKLGVVVFGCLTIPKYRQQLEDIFATWGNTLIQAGGILRFYVGDIPENCSNEMKTICMNVMYGDTYISAMFKQWAGIEDISKYECDFYYVCGSDSFLNVRNAIKALEGLDTKERLYIGDSMGLEYIYGKEYTYFSGGAGFFLTHSAVIDITNEACNFIPWWMDVSHESPSNIHTACDLQMGILCDKLDITIIHIKHMYGVKIYTDIDVDKDTLVSCHPMKHDDMITYFKYLESL